MTGHLSEHPYPAEEEAIREMRRYTSILNPIGHGEWRSDREGQQLRGRIRRSYVDRARPHVIEVLDEAAREAPYSDFLVGHRVGYRIKEGREEEALEVARACQASPWWCLALEGFALHQLRRTAEADSVFRASLEAMPLAHLRCPRNLSLDLSHLDPGDYRVRITVEPEGREGLKMERKLRVVEGQASSNRQEDEQRSFNGLLES